MYHTSCTLARLTVGAAALALCATAGSPQLNATVKVDNLAPTNSHSFSPLHLGLNTSPFHTPHPHARPTQNTHMPPHTHDRCGLHRRLVPQIFAHLRQIVQQLAPTRGLQNPQHVVRLQQAQAPFPIE